MSGTLVGHFKEVKRSQSSKPGKGVQPKQELQQQASGSFTTDHDISEVERVLRAFDLATKYGPCAGITRMERWERAEKFGLAPPTEVRDLLQSMEATSARNQNIWAGRI